MSNGLKDGQISVRLVIHADPHQMPGDWFYRAIYVIRSFGGVDPPKPVRLCDCMDENVAGAWLFVEVTWPDRHSVAAWFDNSDLGLMDIMGYEIDGMSVYDDFMTRCHDNACCVAAMTQIISSHLTIGTLIDAYGRMVLEHNPANPAVGIESREGDITFTVGDVSGLENPLGDSPYHRKGR